MKFQFSFKNVLRHRKILEELAQKDLQDALSILVKLQNQLNQIIQTKEDAKLHSFNKQVDGGLVAHDLQQVNEFVSGQDIRIEAQLKKIKFQEERVEELREILRQRAIDYKIIENLKEKKFEEFKIEQNKIEAKKTDEQNSMRFKLKKASNM